MRPLLGCIDIEGWLATEGIFARFAKRGVADIGHILATSDKGMGKKVPVPKGWERKFGPGELRSAVAQEIFASNAGPPSRSIQPGVVSQNFAA
jgi:hypothetical protein